METAVIVFRSGCLWLWGGAASACTWGQVSSGMVRLIRGTYGGAVDGVCPLQEMTRQEHHIWSEVFEQEPDRQRAPLCCSGGAIIGAAESPFRHDAPANLCLQRLWRLCKVKLVIWGRPD